MAAEQVHGTEACKKVDGGITRVFQLLGKRWTGPIVAVLVEQPAYFAELRRAIPGISERMLSDRLTELARRRDCWSVRSTRVRRCGSRTASRSRGPRWNRR